MKPQASRLGSRVVIALFNFINMYTAYEANKLAKSINRLQHLFEAIKNEASKGKFEYSIVNVQEGTAEALQSQGYKVTANLQQRSLLISWN